MLSREVFVVGATRTAIGGFGGSLKDIPLSSLAATVVRAALDETSSVRISHGSEAHYPTFFTGNCETDHATRSARKAANGAMLRSMLALSRARR